MKKVLVMIPFFMGYEKIILKELSQKYEVTLFNNEQHMNNVHEKIAASVFYRLMRKISRTTNKWMLQRLIELYTYQFIKQIEEEKQIYSVIICINGHYLPQEFLNYLKRNNSNAQWILYLWDDVRNLYQTKYFRYFEHIYSYNIEDCNIRGFRYLPMFVQEKAKYLIGNKEYDLAIIGTAHPDRVEFVNHIYELYKDKYNIYIYLYRRNENNEGWFHNIPLDFTEYMDILVHSKAVIDIPYILQKGPTTRFQDAILSKTKVITTNEHIKFYPFYSNNILIINRENPDISEDFINSEYQENHLSPMLVDNWVKKLLNCKKDTDYIL